ncbi:MAG: VaFE repeat-containing surface-anchored protein [Clostridiaceae bacterium]|nr:VaFE repeat-containing surface-anchored protein [Clostridiaceae bacterium]
MAIKKKNKRYLLILLLILSISLSVFISIIPIRDVEAATISVSHSTGNYITEMDSELYFPGLTMNIPSSAIDYLYEFYDYPRSGAIFFTHGGLYTPEVATIWVEGQLGFCSNPTVLYQPGSFTNRISVTSSILDENNFDDFLNKFSMYRYPVSVLRTRLENFFGGREEIINGSMIVYLSGVLNNSTDLVKNELIRMFEEDNPDSMYKGVVTPTKLNTERYLAMINWIFSLDNYVSVLEGGNYDLGLYENDIFGLNSFYIYIGNQIRAGKIQVKNPYYRTYYSPVYPNPIGLHSGRQVVGSYGGQIELASSGELELLKKSSRPDYTEDNNNYDMTGITFTVFEDAGFTKKVGDLVCDSNGKSNVLTNLIPKDYWLKETKGGKGFHFDSDKPAEKVTVRPNERTTYEAENVPIDDPVSILIEKQDVITRKTTKHANTSLALAEFTIKFYGGDYPEGVDPGAEGITPTRTWVLRTNSNGQVSLASANTSFDFNGQSYPYNVSGDDLYLNDLGIPTLPLGTITIQETKAPEGYLLPDPAPIHIRKIALDETLQNVKTYNVPVQLEHPILGSFTLFKGNEDAEETSIINPEAGAEFVAILVRHVNQHGSFEEALKYLDTYEKNEYSVLVTDNTGNAKSGDLVYGDYIIMQTKGKEETHLYEKPIPLTISSHGQTEHYNINNPNKEFLARIIKKDSVTGEFVILNSASFKIKNKDTDEYVTMKVGTKIYNSFKTTSENAGDIPAGTFYLDTEVPGTAVTPLKLKAGIYIVEEIETPEGYYLLETPIEFKIGEQHVDQVDQDLDEIIEVVVENKPQSGELKLHKKGDLFKEWTTKSVTLPVQKPGKTEQVETEVPRANEALTLTRDWIELKEVEELVEISPETGEKLQPAISEQIVPSVERLVKKKIEVPQQQSETVFTDETGSFSGDFTEKGKYTLTDKSGKVVTSITLAEGETGTIAVTLPAETKVDHNYLPGEAANQDFTYNVATYEEGYLPGAEFELIAKKDIQSWDGQTLFYKKGDKLQLAQKDIVVADKTLYKKGEVITIPTLDQSVMSDQTLVDTKVVTENKELVISRIPLGRYDLVETKAPKGYIKDSTVRSFEFTPQAKTILVDIKETEPIINKRQKLNVSLAKTLKENEYFKDTDFSNIVIGMYTKEAILGLEKDQLVAVVAPNSIGAITVNDVPGGNYYFKEISTKDGYILNTNEYDISIISDEIAEKDKIEVVKEPIVNEPLTKDIKVIKTDKDTGRPLVGVEFKLFKLEAEGKKLPIKNTVTDTYSFFTDQKGEITIKTLPFGTYSLEEVKTIDGYIKDKNTHNVAVSEDFELEVKVTNEATTVGFRKIDSKTGRPVVGSTLKLVDSEGNEIYLDELGYVTTKENGTLAEWITDGNLFFVKGLSIDHGYRVIEVNAPEGYHKGEDLDFTVGANTGIQLTDYPNTPYEPKIKTNAFNKDTNGKTAHAIKSARIIDIIEYVDLIPGRTYKAKAVLVLADDPTQVITEANLEFVPETKDGEIEVDFGVVDLLGLAGEKVVVFESVIDLKTNLVVATHRDDEDPDQTIEIEDPEVGTKARTKDGKNSMLPSKNAVIIDTVSYKNLMVGEEYTVKGVLMDKAIGKPLLINGKEVRAEETFIAKTQDGTVELTFTFDSTGLEGKEFVVFEELYYKGELIAEHKDLEDPDQTIEIEKPEEPRKPVTNDDSINPIFYLAGGSLLLLIAVLLIIKLRLEKSHTRKKKSE